MTYCRIFFNGNDTPSEKALCNVSISVMLSKTVSEVEFLIVSFASFKIEFSGKKSNQPWLTKTDRFGAEMCKESKTSKPHNLLKQVAPTPPTCRVFASVATSEKDALAICKRKSITRKSFKYAWQVMVVASLVVG